MRVLDVYLGNTFIGSIAENHKGGRFTYAPEIMMQQTGLPVLSLSLPVKKRAFGEAKTANWFNGLLPEGPRRDAISKSLGLHPYDWIGLLSKIGWECAGAVRIFPQGETSEHTSQYQEISELELAKSLSDVSTKFFGKDADGFRMSLGGFQEKICVCMPRLAADETVIKAEKVFLPVGEAASTHILKPENEREYPGSAESEAWAMLTASYAARCSQVSLLALDGAPKTLVIERYDRAGSSWPFEAERIHQEDVCQALGLDPTGKYANAREPKGNDPTYKAIADLLTQYADNPEEELAELLRQMTVNFALGNWDAHAKNTSFLYKKPGLPTVAPLYDVVPIAEVEPRTQFLSMRINGHIKPGEISGEDIVTEAVGWGIPSTEAKEIVAECLNGLAAGMDAASVAYPNAAARHKATALARIDRLWLDAS